jgi:hypothetical protein
MSEAISWRLEYYGTPSVNYENQGHKLSLWTEDSSTQPDLVSTEDNQAQELIRQIRYLFPETLADKLVRLFTLAKEERPASPGILISSLSSFYNFLMSNKNITIPSLSLTDDHNIYASWRKPGYVFSIHFLPDESIRFVFFMPNDREPGRKIRISGTATGDTLREVVVEENLRDWVFSAR